MSRTPPRSAGKPPQYSSVLKTRVDLARLTGRVDQVIEHYTDYDLEQLKAGLVKLLQKVDGEEVNRGGGSVVSPVVFAQPSHMIHSSSAALHCMKGQPCKCSHPDCTAVRAQLTPKTPDGVRMQRFLSMPS
jgi:hypothetical protein